MAHISTHLQSLAGQEEYQGESLHEAILEKQGEWVFRRVSEIAKTDY
jgi:hypothetical protein